jgi:hypothetical protein
MGKGNHTIKVLRRVSGYDSGGYKEFYLLGYNVLCFPPAFTLGFLLGLFFNPEDGRNMFLRNVG